MSNTVRTIILKSRQENTDCKDDKRSYEKQTCLYLTHALRFIVLFFKYSTLYLSSIQSYTVHLMVCLSIIYLWSIFTPLPLAVWWFLLTCCCCFNVLLFSQHAAVMHCDHSLAGSTWGWYYHLSMSAADRFTTQHYINTAMVFRAACGTEENI